MRAALMVSTRPAIVVDIGNGDDLDVFTLAGSPAQAVDVTINVNGTVGATTTAAALRIGTGWVAGSTFYMTNNGTIRARGGNGGNGGAGLANGSTGSTGGDAFNLSGQVVSIVNNGYIFGGGGGGGGGAGGSGGNGGGGGGGGRGGAAGYGATGGTGGNEATAGGNGNSSGAGAGGAGETGLFPGGSGGSGGDWGNNGTAGQTSQYASGGSGGAPGHAVRLNGGFVTWLAGYNATQVKGGVT